MMPGKVNKIINRLCLILIAAVVFALWILLYDRPIKPYMYSLPEKYEDELKALMQMSEFDANLEANEKAKIFSIGHNVIGRYYLTDEIGFLESHLKKSAKTLEVLENYAMSYERYLEYVKLLDSIDAKSMTLYKRPASTHKYKFLLGYFGPFDRGGIYLLYDPDLPEISAIPEEFGKYVPLSIEHWYILAETP